MLHMTQLKVKQYDLMFDELKHIKVKSVFFPHLGICRVFKSKTSKIKTLNNLNASHDIHSH